MGGINGIPCKAGSGCDALGFSAGNRNDEQITVRADRFHLVRHCGEANLFSIRRKINISRPAPLIRWNVVVRSWREVSWCRASIRGNDEQMAVLPVVPVRPVAG